MTPSGDFGPMMPGLDFMQKLMQSAGATMPGLGAWMTPTLDPAELDKRIADLRTVQFWLEQNARLIATTIQTLEVQRMTLSTLKNLNLSVADLSEAFTLKDNDAATPAKAKAAPAAEAGAARQTGKARRSAQAPSASAGAAPAGGLIDPVQWWTTLTQQFTEMATRAVRDSAAAAGTNATAAPDIPGEAAQAASRAAAVPAAHNKTRSPRKSSRGAPRSR